MARANIQALAALLLLSLFVIAERMPYDDGPEEAETEAQIYWAERGSGVFIVPSPSMRSNFFNGGDGYLAAYPSIGGVVLARPSAIDLHYLGINRTHDEKRLLHLGPGEEDDLAARMLQLGAQWWPDWETYVRHRSQINQGIFYDFHFPPEVHVGYPSTGGVWVAKFTQDEGRHYESEGWAKKHWLPPRPDYWRKRMWFVLTMDEKCDAMKDFGAIFYDTVEDCPDIAKTAEEGRENFILYEELLEKMYDDTYRRRWESSVLEVFQEYMNDDADEEHDESVTKRWAWWILF